MGKQNLERDKQIIFRVDENEYNYIKERMKHYGYTKMSTYLRMVAIRSKVVIDDRTELKQLNKEINAIGRNINQIAVRVNSTDRAYEEDIKELKEQMEKIWQLLISTQSGLH